jgi:hypothetical protein
MYGSAVPKGENQFSDSSIRSGEKRKGALAAVAKGLFLRIILVG